MSLLASATYIVAMVVVSIIADDLSLAVYSLSFWHYYLYALAYRYGEIEPAAFRRDAVAMKTAALVVLAVAYLASPLNVASLVVVALGFALNAAGARALGAERTYYGRELNDLQPIHVTSFPFSVVSHPMLVGNMVAFGGTLLNGQFRNAWWPLAVAHVALNAGLLFMERFVEPLRRRVRRKNGEWVASASGAADVVLRIGILAAVTIAIGSCLGWPLSASVASALYASVMFHFYSAPARMSAAEIGLSSLEVR